MKILGIFCFDVLNVKKVNLNVSKNNGTKKIFLRRRRTRKSSFTGGKCRYCSWQKCFPCTYVPMYPNQKHELCSWLLFRTKKVMWYWLHVIYEQGRDYRFFEYDWYWLNQGRNNRYILNMTSTDWTRARLVF